jgi:hypothetical protein
MHRQQLCRRFRDSLRSPAGTPPPPDLAAAPNDLRTDLRPVPPPQTRTPEEDSFCFNVSRQGAAWIGRWLRDYRVGGGAARALERLLQRCRQRQIGVVLVGVPVSSSQRQVYTPEIDAAFLGYVRRLTSTYGCAFVDYRARLPDHCFCDSHHATPEGGVYFSSLLACEVLLDAFQHRETR